ncbi:unnamed protein product [Soboliphyme baturini]|uniref:Histidine kinase n=1 Tax=Soboliphyme baturini TaxID=241478 RepID=A0A183IDH8_9BILA|nr:unnamed protein product [Soboliphyme baturini]
MEDKCFDISASEKTKRDMFAVETYQGIGLLSHTRKLHEMVLHKSLGLEVDVIANQSAWLFVRPLNY